jgi:hypothetical protein
VILISRVSAGCGASSSAQCACQQARTLQLSAWPAFWGFKTPSITGDCDKVMEWKADIAGDSPEFLG